MAIIYNTCSNGSQVNLCIDSSMRSSKLYVVSHRPKRTSKGFKQVIRRSVQKVAEFKVVNSGSCSDPKLSIVLLIKSEKGCYSVKIVLKNSTKVQAVSKLVREPRVHFWWYLRWSLSNVEYLLKIKNMVSAMSEIVKLDAVLSRVVQDCHGQSQYTKPKSYMALPWRQCKVPESQDILGHLCHGGSVRSQSPRTSWDIPAMETV